jgi:hypothetical protein
LAESGDSVLVWIVIQDVGWRGRPASDGWTSIERFTGTGCGGGFGWRELPVDSVAIWRVGIVGGEVDAALSSNRFGRTG